MARVIIQHSHGRFRLLAKNALLLFMLIYPQDSLWAQSDHSIDVESLQPSSVSARSAGLAGAAPALASDISSVYDNPAGLPFTQRVTVSIDGRYDVAVRLFDERITVPVLFGSRDFVSIGVSLKHTNFLNGGIAEAPRILRPAMHMGYAIALLSSLSIGGRVEVGSVFQSEKPDLPRAGGALGILYHPFTGVAYGAVLDGIGWEEQVLTRDQAGNPVWRKRPLRFQFGASIRHPSSLSRPIVIISVFNGKELHRRELQYKGGVEVWAIPEAALRFGYGAEHGGTSIVTTGLGVRLQRVQIDYAASLKSDFGRFHQLSISVDLLNRETEF